MGYARYTVRRNGETIDAGYDVDDICNQEGCTVQIDRGLEFLCGETPGGDEHGCGGYFCGGDLFYSFDPGDEADSALCARCRDRSNHRSVNAAPAGGASK